MSHNRCNWRAITLASILLSVSALSAQRSSDQHQAADWHVAGQNLSNTWSQPREHSINPANANRLTPKWVFTTGGDVSATPTVGGDAVYFPDWSGNLFAVNKKYWAPYLVSQDLGVRRSRRSYLSRESRGGWQPGNYWGHSQLQSGAQRRQRDGNRPRDRIASMDYASGNASSSNHYWISGCFRRRCLHRRLFERGESGDESRVSVLQLSRQHRCA